LRLVPSAGSGLRASSCRFCLNLPSVAIPSLHNEDHGMHRYPMLGPPLQWGSCSSAEIGREARFNLTACRNALPETVETTQAGDTEAEASPKSQISIRKINEPLTNFY
jgi:hypothetical protein